MAFIEATLIGILALLLLVVLSSLPLYSAVKVLGGRTTIFKTFLVMLAVGVLGVFVKIFFWSWAEIIFFLLVIIIFREAFRLKWYKAILAWILWMVFIVVFSVLFSLFGLSIAFFSFLI